MIRLLVTLSGWSLLFVASANAAPVNVSSGERRIRVDHG